MSATAPSPLNVEAIVATIDDTCARWSQGSQWNVRRARDAELVKSSKSAAECNLFGIVLRLLTDEQQVEHMASFYLAYSTWDGRVLYVDRMNLANTTGSSRDGFIVLADIAVKLKCARLTWQHLEHQIASFPDSITPEFMNGWLTLHWSRDAIDQFVKIDELPVETDLNCTRAIIERCLVSGTAPSNFRLRLTEIDDVDSIYRLVQGLADFEKETDAVHVTPQFFNNDGFITPRPLFYCLLLETMKEETMKEEKWCSCGIALCYVGCKVGEGSFLYLEDLFIEKSHRCQGAGSYVMRILGVIALSLNCSKLVWQALDWNTAALTFYKKIGAEIVDGLLTSRFKGKSLQQLREQQMSK